MSTFWGPLWRAGCWKEVEFHSGFSLIGNSWATRPFSSYPVLLLRTSAATQMNPDSPCLSASEASPQQRYFNAAGWWWRANTFRWQEGPQEMLLVGLEVKRAIPTWVCGRPLPSFPPWGFLLARHLLSCLGYCKKGKNCSGLRELELCFGKDTHIDLFLELWKSSRFWGLGKMTPWSCLSEIVSFPLEFGWLFDPFALTAPVYV